MKKILFSLMAVAVLFSCTKEQVSYQEATGEVSLSPVASMTTKGTQHGTTYQNGDFGVYAYWNLGQTVYFGNPTDGVGVPFTEVAPYYEGKDVDYYWPKNGKLQFACYSPYTVHENNASAIIHDYATDTYTVTGYVQESNTGETTDFMLAPVTSEFDGNAVSVPVVFEHALSWITLKFKSKLENAFKVKKVVINDVNTVADLSAVMSGDTKGKTWSNHQEPVAYNVFEAEGTVLTETAVTFETNQNGTVVIPQKPTTLTITFDQIIESAATLEDQVITVALDLGEELEWEPGKHYTYTVIFDADEIRISPSVVDWIDVPTDCEEEGQTIAFVDSEAKLVEALAEGGTVTLVNNITLSERLTLKEDVDVTLNLNGKTLTTTAKDHVLVVEAGTLTINGDGEVKGQDKSFSYPVWARGGDIVINGGTYTSGTDPDSGTEVTDYTNAVIYSSKGVITINGGTFKIETAVTGLTDIAHFLLNCYDTNYPATANIIVKGGTFYEFNPANNTAEGAGTDFVADGFTSAEATDGTNTYYTVTE